MARLGPLDTVHEWVLVQPSEIYHGPFVLRHAASFRGMLDLMTRWAAARCIGPDATLWRQTRRGWVCEGNG